MRNKIFAFFLSVILLVYTVLSNPQVVYADSSPAIDGISVSALPSVVSQFMITNGLLSNGLNRYGLKTDSEQFKTFKSYFNANAVLNNVLEDVNQYASTYDKLTTYSSPLGWKIYKDASNTFKLALSSTVQKNARSAVNEYYKSSDNVKETNVSVRPNIDKYNIAESSYKPTNCYPDISDITKVYPAFDLKKFDGLDLSNYSVAVGGNDYTTSYGNSFYDFIYDNYGIKLGSTDEQRYKVFLLCPIDKCLGTFEEIQYTSRYSYADYYVLGAYNKDFAISGKYTSYVDAYNPIQFLVTDYSGKPLTDLLTFDYYNLNWALDDLHYSFGNLLNNFFNDYDTYIFNYKSMLNNDCYIFNYSYNSNRTVFTVPFYSKESIISKSSADSKIYSITDDDVTLNLDKSLDSIASTVDDLAVYVRMIAELSAELQALKDSIQGGLGQVVDSNAVNANKIVSSISSQTTVLSEDLGEIVSSIGNSTTVLSDIIAQLDDTLKTILGTNESIDSTIVKGFSDLIAGLNDISITVPAPEVTVETYPSITVESDLTGVGTAVASQMDAVLTDIFVPDYSLVEDFFNNNSTRFGFIGSISDSISGFFDWLKSIQPTPILRIPISQADSKYNYGLGDYFVIDMSWYARFKEYGDTLISAFLWLTFLWRVFIKLPSLIQGISGASDTFNNSQNKD